MTIEFPRSETLQEALRNMLEAHLHQRNSGVSERDSLDLCERLGIWPAPATHVRRCQALAVVAARALPLFNAEPPVDTYEEHLATRFEQYRLALDTGDYTEARVCAALLRLWSHGDSRAWP